VAFEHRRAAEHRAHRSALLFPGQFLGFLKAVHYNAAHHANAKREDSLPRQKQWFQLFGTRNHLPTTGHHSLRVNE
jgi:hypothetical protein